MNLPTKVWLHGYTGRMGVEIRNLIAKDSTTWDLVGGTTKSSLVDAKNPLEKPPLEALSSFLPNPDLIIDFSTIVANLHLLEAFTQSSATDKYIIIGTTGLPQQQIMAWKQYASAHGSRLLFAPNTSLGVLLTLKVSELLAQVLTPLGFDIEILESHHREKLDAPSGTAKIIGDTLVRTLDKDLIYGREGKRNPREIGLASLRGGSIFGEHEVKFLGDNEELSVAHRALNRQLFAAGSLILAKWLLQKPSGIYQLEDISIEDMVKLLR